MKRIDYIIKNGDSRKTDLILKKLDLMRQVAETNAEKEILDMEDEKNRLMAGIVKGDIDEAKGLKDIVELKKKINEHIENDRLASEAIAEFFEEVDENGNRIDESEIGDHDAEEEPEPEKPVKKVGRPRKK